MDFHAVRSADQVRQACRPYVDAGRVSPEGLESIVRLFNLGRARGYSFDQTGALVEYSGATMSRLFGGKYEGALDKLRDELVRQIIGRLHEVRKAVAQSVQRPFFLYAIQAPCKVIAGGRNFSTWFIVFCRAG